MRAAKDKADRERIIEKAKLLFKDKARIRAFNKRGGKKYLKETTEGNIDRTLDEAAISKDARFDGYYALQTSEKDICPP